jgi:hypothetical protein
VCEQKQFVNCRFRAGCEVYNPQQQLIDQIPNGFTIIHSNPSSKSKDGQLPLESDLD